MGRMDITDIRKEVRKLKNRKAVGLDFIPNEFLKQGGGRALEMLRDIYNVVLDEGIYPGVWKKGWTAFIPKPGSDGSLDTMRGLTINSSVGKVMLKVIQGRITEDVEGRGVLGGMQHGFRRGYQTIDALFILTDTIARRKVRGDRTAAAFIDIKKAYDWVNRDVLWAKLEEMGFGVRVVGFLREMYEGTSTRVRFRDVETEEIPVKVGLKQGCCLSPILFAIYIQEIGVDLLNSGEGVMVGPEGARIKIPALLFADDLVLIADGEEGLQRLLDIVGHGASKLGMTLSPGKSKILVSWRGVNVNRGWKCGSMEIKEGKARKITVTLDEEGDYKYLGVWVKLHGDMFESQGKAMLAKAKRHEGVNNVLLRKANESVWVADKLWKVAALPAILYGSEVVLLGVKQVERIEGVQRRVIRNFLKAHNGCSIAAMYGEMGWRNIKFDVDLRLLRFAGRLWPGVEGGLPRERWVSLVFMEGVDDIKKGRRVTPWWNRLSNRIMYYGLDMDLISKGPEWRQHVDKQIGLKADREWRESMFKEGGQLKSTLRYYVTKNRPQYEAYLRGGWEKKREVFRLRTGQAMLNSIKAKWDKGVEGLCVLCKKERETEEHIVLGCPRLNRERKEMFAWLQLIVGPHKWGQFVNMGEGDQMAWVLGLEEAIAVMGKRELWREVFRFMGRMLYTRDRVAEKGEKGKGRRKGAKRT